MKIKLKVKHKLYLGFNFLVIMIIALGLFFNSTLKQINQEVVNIKGVSLYGIDKARGIHTLISNYKTAELRHLYLAKTPEDKQSYDEEMKDLRKQIEKLMKDYEDTIVDAHDRELFAKVKEHWGKYISISEQGLVNSRENKMDLIEQTVAQSRNEFTQFNTAVDALVKFNQEGANESFKNSQAVYQHSRHIAIIIITITSILGFLMGLLISRSISKPIDQLENSAKELTQGDLTIPDVVLKNQDEIGNLATAFNTLKNTQKDIIKKLAATSSNLTDMAGTLSSQAQQTSASATETATTMAEVSASVEEVSGNIQRIGATTEEGAQQAKQGEQSVTQAITQMQTIDEAALGVKDVFEAVNKKSIEINQIVELITNIADQTNLLALNAAIEAARAGEAGKGFAVVAEEVRKLAENSANATKSIKQSIEAIQTETLRAVESMGVARREVDAGKAIVQETGVAFKEIITGVDGLVIQFESITAATEQMSSAVQNIAAATEEQTASIEEVSALAESLSSLAEELNGLIKQFKI
jgi:methyl-accepting chemotaxis protein